MIEDIYVVFCLLFPIGYMLYKKVNNELLFISAVVGVTSIISTLVFVLLVPFGLFNIYFYPSYQDYVQIDSTNWLAWFEYASIFIQSNLVVLILTLLIVTSFLIFRRYKSFFTSEENPRATSKVESSLFYFRFFIYGALSTAALRYIAHNQLSITLEWLLYLIVGGLSFVLSAFSVRVISSYVSLALKWRKE